MNGEMLPGPDASMDDMIKCGVCQKTLQDPKTLLCQHTYCLHCIEEKEDGEERFVECPQCKELTPLLAGINELNTSFVIENLLEINRKFNETEQEIKEDKQQKERVSEGENQQLGVCTSGSEEEGDSDGNINEYIINDSSHSIINEFHYPWGVTKGVNGEMIVAEWGGDRVTMVTRGKRFYFGGEKGCSNEIIKPRGVAVNKDKVLVTSSNRITVYNNEGRYITSSKGNNKIELLSPSGLKVHPQNGLVYVTDSDNHRILVLSDNLEYIKEFGTQDSKRGATSFPWDVAFDSEGLVYVADSKSKILKYSPDGKFMSSLGIKDRLISRPSSLSIKNDILHVTELYSNRVSVFDKEGGCISCYEGRDELQLNGPCGIHVDNNNELILSDCWNNRLILVKQ